MRGRYTPKVVETVVRLGSRLTYQETQEELEMLWGVSLSKTTIREMTIHYGQIGEKVVMKEIKEIQEGKEVERCVEVADQMVMSIDGGMILTTTGEWREVKTMAVGQFEARFNKKEGQIKAKTDQISYFSRIEEAAQFCESSIYEWHKRGMDKASQIVAVNDGAIWIQHMIDYHCPEAIRVIDFAHALEYVAKIGRLIYGAESDTFKTWYSKMSKQLGTKPPSRTLNDLRFLRKSHQNHPQFDDIDLAIRYLETREEMIDYAHFRHKGVPIGSGIVESAHRLVVHRRMKQAGMRWAVENINPMLVLRNALCNRRWSKTWKDIQQWSQQEDEENSSDQVKTSVVSHRVIGSRDIKRLEKMAEHIQYLKAKRPWQDHRAIFPERYS